MSIGSAQCHILGQNFAGHRRQGDIGVLLSRHPGVAAAPRPGERVLDIGCGWPEGNLVGVDLLGVGHASPPCAVDADVALLRNRRQAAAPSLNRNSP